MLKFGFFSVLASRRITSVLFQSRSPRRLACLAKGADDTGGKVEIVGARGCMARVPRTTHMRAERTLRTLCTTRIAATTSWKYDFHLEGVNLLVEKTQFSDLDRGLLDSD